MNKIFISYSRNDDERFVWKLYQDLSARGLDVWFDRMNMPSRNLSFHQEIRDSIAERDILLLVCGPNATLSEYVNQEWRFAFYEAEKIVTPILRVGDYSSIPDLLKSLHCEDFREDDQYDFHLSRIVKILSEPVPQLGRLVGVPSLPTYVLPRNEYVTKIRESLTRDLISTSIVDSSASRVGLHGMGGVGKSVLAAMLARSRKVRESFRDGVVWIRLGETPNMTLRMQYVYRELGGTEAIKSVENGTLRLRSLLHDKTVLLVLDDAWHRQDLDAFDVLGPRCRALITTRDRGLIISIGCIEQIAEYLTDEESMTLLGMSSGLNITEVPLEGYEVLKECGNLPLAISLAGGMIQCGTLWPDIVDALHEREIEFLEDRHAANDQHTNVWKLIAASVSALTNEQQRRLFELAVFPEEAIPEAAVITLWQQSGLQPRSARKLLIELDMRSLLRRQSLQSFSGSAATTVSIHGLIYDFCVRSAYHCQEDERGLHALLVDSYRRLSPEGWWTGQNDGYILTHLRYHLISAGQTNELLDLVLELQWLEAKADACLVHDLPFDFDAALAATPPDDERGILYKTIAQALRHDLNFISRHPKTIFQCIWNLCWSYDHNKASQNLVSTPRDSGVKPQPQKKEVLRLSTIMNQWKNEKSVRDPDFMWLRCLRPIPSPLGTNQLACMTPSANLFDLDAASSFELDSLFEVRTVAISPDGSTIASGHSDRTVRIWSSSNYTELNCFRGHTAKVNSVTFSPDGRLVASVSDDSTLRIWETVTGTEISCLRGHQGAVNDVAWSRLSNSLASSGIDATLRIWDFEHAAEVSCIHLHSGTANAICFSPDGAQLASAGSDSMVRIWDVCRGIELTCLHGHEGAVLDVDMSPHGDTIATAGSDGSVRLWDVKRYQELKQIAENDSAVLGVAFSPDGQRIVSGLTDTTIRILDVKSGTELSCIKGHQWRVHTVTYSPDGNYIVSGSLDGTIRLWTTSNSPSSNSAMASTLSTRIRCIRVSPNNRIFVGGYSLNNGVLVLDAITGRELKWLKGPDIGNVNWIEFSPTGSRVYIEYSEEVIMFSGDSLEPMHSLPEPPKALGLELARTPDSEFALQVNGNELIVERKCDGRQVAWFPMQLENISIFPSGRAWAGSIFKGLHLALLSLEGVD